MKKISTSSLDRTASRSWVTRHGWIPGSGVSGPRVSDPEFLKSDPPKPEPLEKKKNCFPLQFAKAGETLHAEGSFPWRQLSFDWTLLLYKYKSGPQAPFWFHNVNTPRSVFSMFLTFIYPPSPSSRQWWGSISISRRVLMSSSCSYSVFWRSVSPQIWQICSSRPLICIWICDSCTM